jgi:hypothetical protein
MPVGSDPIYMNNSLNVNRTFLHSCHCTVHRVILCDSASSFGIEITLPDRPVGKWEFSAKEETSATKQTSGAPKLPPSHRNIYFSPHHFIAGKGLIIKHEFLRCYIHKLNTILTALCWLGCDNILTCI